MLDLTTIEWLSLEGALKMILFYTPTYPSLVKVAIYQIKLPMTPYNPALNASRDGMSAASLGKLFQLLHLLSKKIYSKYLS